MACPYFSPLRRKEQESDLDEKPTVSEGKTSTSEDDVTYGNYLKLEQLLICQTPLSGSAGLTPIHDEHLFIVTHQAFELWFKQIIHEINSVQTIFMSEYLEERNSLIVISRINRVVSILKLCTEQFAIIETITPQDFLDFRDYLGIASGFQSFQFRMMEILLGVQDNLRVSYNRTHFIEAFHGEERKKLTTAMSEPSLLDLVNNWLARTPGLKEQTFGFWSKFKCSVKAMLSEMATIAEEEKDSGERERLMSQHRIKEKHFNTIFDEKRHNDLLKKNERRLSYNALQGALMIYFYRDELRFHLPFQLLQSLMNIDNQLSKFRHNHTCMVQRMIGNKDGTGGSSGYLYLRSTCSDRYTIFLDLLNLASYLVPRDRIPPLTIKMRQSLSIHDENEDRDSGITSGSSTRTNIRTNEEKEQNTDYNAQIDASHETQI